MIVIRVILGIIFAIAILDCLNLLEPKNENNKFYIFCLIVYTLVEILLIKGW